MFRKKCSSCQFAFKKDTFTLWSKMAAPTFLVSTIKNKQGLSSVYCYGGIPERNDFRTKSLYLEVFIRIMSFLLKSEFEPRPPIKILSVCFEPCSQVVKIAFGPCPHRKFGLCRHPNSNHAMSRIRAKMNVIFSRRLAVVSMVISIWSYLKCKWFSMG